MNRSADRRGMLLRALVPALLALALAACPTALAAATKPVKPHATTGGVQHVRGTSGQLEGVVNPNGVETSYYFQYGPTVAYGSQTKSTPVGAGQKGVKVGQPVTGLLNGYHYRIVATNALGTTATGQDKVFNGGKSNRLKINVPKGKEEEIQVVYGGTLELAGNLTGEGSANHGLLLQGDPYPFTDPFTTLAGPVLSSATGGYLFKLAKMTQNTELRLLTVDTRPMYSAVVSVHVTPSIKLRVHALGGGRYRFYGTLAPAKLLGLVTIQQLLPQKADSKRSGPKPHAVGVTKLKKGQTSSIRFNTVLSGLTGTFHYRAYIKLPKGSLDSGHSNDVLVHGPKAAVKKHRNKK